VTGGFPARVARVCDVALDHLGPGAPRDAVAAIRERLAEEPLRLAVAGGISSGKSTLVNALLGQRVATVDAGECTFVVTWYRYSPRERIELHLHDGTTRSLPFSGERGLPAELGVPVGEVARIDVWLSNDTLEHLTIIDTPGLNTTTEANRAAAEDLLGLDPGSRRAVGQADALLYLMPYFRSFDEGVLQTFKALFGGTGLSAVNAVGVLSKIDKLAGGDDDPWAVAAPIVERGRAALASVVLDVVPLMGLLAETAVTDRFTERDARALAELAALDPLDLEDLLIDAEGFATSGLTTVAPEVRARLLAMLDLHGLRVALAAIAGGTTGAVALRRHFEEVARFDAVRQLVDDVFARRAGLLKAHGALADLQRLAANGSDDPAERAFLRGELADLLDALVLDPELHDLRVLDVARAAAAGDMKVPAERLEEVTLLARHADPAARLGIAADASADQIVARAAELAATWGAFAGSPRRSPTDARRATVVKTAYEHLLAGARSGSHR
jgi:hypothetical protein